MVEKNQAERHPTLFGAIFWFFMRIITWGMLGWLFVIVLGATMVFFFGENTGLAYLHKLLDGQIRYLSIICRGFVNKLPLCMTASVTYFVYQWLFVKTNLINFTQSLDAYHISHKIDVTRLINVSHSIIVAYLQVLILATELVIAKIMTLLFSLFGMVLILLVGVVDGLVQRDIRKFCCDRESSFLYHRAKSVAVSFIIIGCFVYLILPLDIAPEFILLPTAAISSYFLMLSIKLFKKTA